MRPFGFDDRQSLQIAKEHAAELRRDWRSANAPRDIARRPVRRPDETGLLLQARASAGRRLIGLGTRLMSERSEPCA